MANCESDVMLETLLRYKAMALDHSKHDTMLKDKTVLQFLAYSLDSDDSEAVEASLKTVELLIHNNKNHETLRTTFGVYEALKATSERDNLEESIRSLAKELYHKLEEPPCVSFERSALNISSENLAPNKRKLTSKVYSFHIFGLNEDTRKCIESAVIRIRGVISVIIDTGHQRCVVRALESVTPQTLVECIARETKLEARLVSRNKLRQEVLVDLGKNENSNADNADDGDLPQYLPEEESPVKEKAVHTFDRLRTSAASWVRSATALFQNSFYW